MLDFSDINWLAVAAATIANMVIGALWYSPLLLGPAWMKASGKTKDECAESGKQAIALAIIPAFITATGIALGASWWSNTAMLGGIAIGVSVWFFFSATTSYLGVLFGGTPLKVWLINQGEMLLSYAVMGAILGAWR